MSNEAGYCSILELVSYGKAFDDDAYKNFWGFYKKQKREFNDRMLYKKLNDTYLWFNQETLLWMVSVVYYLKMATSLS